MIKRCFALVLSLIFILSFTACGTKDQPPEKEPESRPSSASEPAVQPAPEDPAASESTSSGEGLGEADPSEGSAQPSQGDEVPDLEAEETPDPDGQEPSGEEDHPGDTELKNKMTRLGYAVDDWFYTQMPESCYNYYYLSHDGEGFVLTVGVTDEAALDEGLASWTGEKWDRLVKEPARVSRAELGELAEAVDTLDLGSVVKISAYVQPAGSYEEIGVLVVLTPKDPEAAPPEDTSLWDEVPKEVEELAGEYSIPMDLVSYRPPVF